ncbi:hypothetical protein [Acinetobacter sp. ANC 3832]|uniref:hypothetical protein n=1 Tax=Acinetobacter sp. ANC 3832 TaxID=1977874 RepID=UPI000B6DE78E|nr:hypothetical protein [Acinetobacter sp. ANC 3832]OTG86890.1 hypothetical protein B9T35_17910 [Acinetobacter sp. ANC 3832]
MHKKIVLSLFFVFLTACFQRDKQEIPQEGEIVFWKQDLELIVKAKLGPRREHIPSQFDYEFYRPAREHYLGQFPIDYVPEKFQPITQQQADSLPRPDSNRQLQFDLKLGNSDFQATDGPLPDHDDQVRVRIEGLTMDMRADNLDTYKTFIQRKEFFKENSKFEKYGLTCYQKKVADNFYGCYGKSKGQHVTGVLLNVIALEITPSNQIAQIRGNSYEPNKYGGIWVQWETNLNNWDKWQEIDNAIWRLLDTWNAAPSSQKSN